MTRSTQRTACLLVLSLTIWVGAGHRFAIAVQDPAPEEAGPQRTEPPIKVRNGSVTIEGLVEWQDAQDSWTPGNAEGCDEFVVTIVPDPDTMPKCSSGLIGQGKRLRIESAGGSTLTLRARPNSNVYRAHLTPRGAVVRDPQNKKILRVNKASHLTKITVDQGPQAWHCTFTKEEQKLQINICPGGGTTSCP